MSASDSGATSSNQHTFSNNNAKATKVSQQFSSGGNTGVQKQTFSPQQSNNNNELQPLDEVDDENDCEENNNDNDYGDEEDEQFDDRHNRNGQNHHGSAGMQLHAIPSDLKMVNPSTGMRGPNAETSNNAVATSSSSQQHSQVYKSNKVGNAGAGKAGKDPYS